MALFAANNGAVSRGQWRTYIDTLNIEEHYPGIQGIGFAQLLKPAELSSHLAAIRAQGFPDYTIHPAGEREEYTAIVYLEPFDQRNRRAFGYDMFSEPLRHAAMERARDSGRAALSGKVRLVQETDSDIQAGFLIYLPVYQNGRPASTVAERRAALLGYVYSPFRANNLFNALFEGDLNDIDLEIYDGLEASAAALIYDGDTCGITGVHEHPGAYTAQKVLDLHGRQWSLVFSSLPPFDSKIDQHSPWVILFAGNLLSVLVFLAILVQERGRVRVAAKVMELAEEIKERQRVEKNLIEAQKQAELANRAKSEFLANMSHELRTPLNSVIGFTEVLQDQLFGPVNEKQREYLGDIGESGRHLLGLINDILDLAKVEAGKMELELGHFPCREVLQSAQGMLKEKALKNGLRLVPEIDLPEGLIVEGDERKLKQIMFNLLSNAVKFTPAGGCVKVGARLAPAGPGANPGHGAEWLEISVTDRGIGIKPEEQGRLFQPFSQLESPYSKNYQGTGLGLALTRRLVELHGGRIWLESEFGRGSTFSFTIPLRQPQE